MSRYKYCVITGIPKPWEGGDGNLASASFAFKDHKGARHFKESDLYLQDNTYGGGKPEGNEYHRPRAVTYEDMDKILRNPDESFMVPVFELGEICILNESEGREVAGRQRAPRKWIIDYEEFNSLDKAVARARVVLRQDELLSMHTWYLEQGGQEFITPEEKAWLEEHV